MSLPYVVGLTGGIGSGKSAVTREFERLGIEIVDADIVSREVVAPGSEGLAEVVAEFGHDILDESGNIDRRKLREIVFQDERKRLRLEAILHPRIRDRIDEMLAAVRSEYAILCVPLMVEKRGYENVDRLLVVDCPEELQIARVMARDELTQPQVEAIMQTQATRESRLAVADDVVENSDTLEALRPQVDRLHQRYVQAAKSKSLVEH